MEASRATWTGLARQGSTVSWGSWRESWLAMPEQSVVQHEAWRQTLALYARDAVRQLEPDLHPDPQVLPSLVRQACSQIQKEHAEPLHLKDVARRMGVSAEHLSRLFHQNTGLRFREYLAETRIDTACRALKNSDLPISQIAHESGFATLSRFNECFKKHRNMTPREWRKRARLSSRALSPSVEF